VKKLSDETYHNHAGMLSKRHPGLARVTNLVGIPKVKIPKWKSLNDAILYSVIGQMLSNSASNSILMRLSREFRNTEDIILWAHQTKSTTGALLGVSQKKRRTLSEWGNFRAHHEDVSMHWGKVHLDEFRREVTKIWGLGRWSADMLGIFYFGRLDIWPETDTSIKTVSNAVFGSCQQSEIAVFIDGSETVAALYFWEITNRKLLAKLVHGQSD